MDDYEHSNALEWDVDYSGSGIQQASDDPWQVAGGSRKQQKQPQRSGGQVPSAVQPPTRTSGNLFDALQNTPTPAVMKLPQSPTTPTRQNAKPHNQGQECLQHPQPSGPELSRRERRVAQSQSRSHNRAPENTKPPKQHMKPQHHNVKQSSQQSPSQPQQPMSTESSSPQVFRGLSQPLQQQSFNSLMSPREWPKQEPGQQGSKQRRAPPKLFQRNDNIGARLWRNREEAQDHVQIPAELVLQFSRHLDIAKYHNTFVFDDNESGGPQSKTFGIWGEPQAVAATKRDIGAWIDAPPKSNKPDKFAKLCSLTPELRNRAEKKWARDVRRHRFRQFPPPGMMFEAIGSFHWPVDDYRPDEVLGMSYEALDPIRMDCKAYVVFDKEKGQFQILGKADAVQKGLMRLRGAYFQIAARELAPLERYLLEWFDSDNTALEVVLREYVKPGAIAGKYSGDTETAYSPVLGDTEYGRMAPELQNQQTILFLRRSVLSTLKKLHYYHGSIQMRIRLGTFLATSFVRTEGGVYSIERYQTMIEQSGFHGRVTQELGDKGVESAVLHTIQGAIDLFTPKDAMITHLIDVEPVYTAIFTFIDSTNSEAGDTRLTITFENSQDSGSSTPAFQPTSKKWTRMDRNIGAPSSILDVSFSDLNTGMAWQFEIHAAQSMEEFKLPNKLAEFGDSVRIDPGLARKAIVPSTMDISFTTYNSSLSLKHVEHRITYRYGLMHSDYTLELTRFQHRDISPPKSPIEPRWSLSIYGNEWDRQFSENERLQIGEKADWSHEEKEWFPNDSIPPVEGESQDGFEYMMSSLKAIAKVVLAGQEEHLMGGMKVG